MPNNPDLLPAILQGRDLYHALLAEGVDAERAEGLALAVYRWVLRAADR